MCDDTRQALDVEGKWKEVLKGRKERSRSVRIIVGGGSEAADRAIVGLKGVSHLSMSYHIQNQMEVGRAVEAFNTL